MKVFQRKGFTVFAVLVTMLAQLPLIAASPETASADPVENKEIVLSGDVLPGKVIVKYKQQAGSGTRSLRTRSAQASGSSLITTLSFDRDTPVADKMAELIADPSVEYVEPVYRTYLLSSSADTSVTGTVYSGPDVYMKHWGAIAADLDEARAYTTPEQNQEVTVAVIDTGIDMKHPHFGGTIVQGYDFVNQDGDPQDDNGHGTHVSGIITSNPSGTGIENTAVAPGVRIMPLKVLDATGDGDTASLIEALKYAIAQKADIVNMSLGIAGDSKAIRDLIRQAYDQKIVTIAAAGNSSNHWILNEMGQLDTVKPDEDKNRYAMLTSYPAAYDEVISVGAIAQLPDRSYAVADFSDVGKIDVVAPGVYIYSSVLGGKYDYKSGTSQAAPFVTGFAALLKAYNPDLDQEDIGTILRTSAMQGPFQAVNAHKYNYFTEQPNDHVSDTMVYGAGLIQGERGFKTPRLKLTPVSVPYPAERSATYNMQLLDIHNTVIEATYQVGLEARYYMETQADRGLDPLYGAVTGELDQGTGELTVNLSNNPSIHHIYVYGYWLDPAAAEAFRNKRSNLYSFISRPTAPTVNLASGTYTGQQQVTIASPYSEGKIYYQLATTDRISYGTFPPTGGTLTIDKNSELTVVLDHSNVYSDEAVYEYTIQAASIPTGGGGYIPMTPPVQAEKPGLIMPSTDDLLKQLDSAAKLTIHARGNGTEEVTVQLETAVLHKADELGKSITVETDSLQIGLPPRSLELDNAKNGTFRLKIHKLAPDGTVPAAQLRSPVYDLSMTVDDKPVTGFLKPVQMIFQVNPAQVAVPHQTGVYTFHESSQTWEYAGGRLDPVSGTILVNLNHFSKYAVMEKNNTFQDIQGHWAQREIEAMAAWGIVDGMTDTQFMPEAKVTRAQMAALFSKALKLKSPGTMDSFNDVTGQDWFAGYVYAAKQAGLIEGLGDNKFGPLQNMTREQLAVILLNTYLHETGKETKDIAITQEQFYSDEGNISSWARNSVRLTNALGLMGSVADNVFDSKGETTRAQAATVIHRLLTLLEEGDPLLPKQ